jgi:hypothetical protein
VPRARYFQVAWVCLFVGLAATHVAHADARQGEGGAYDLRIAVVPVAFQAAVSQGWFGSAARVEYEVMRRLDLAVRGRLAWWAATGEHSTHSYAAEFALALHVSDELEQETLAGTVYPEDTPAIQGIQPGTDKDLMDIPLNQRMGSGRMTVGDYDPTLMAAMRKVQCLRLGGGFLQVVERALPEANRSTRNRLPYVYAGYSFATHWNLPASTTGKREVGWRRFYFDALVTTDPLTKAEPDQTSTGTKLSFLPVGARMGIEGTLAALWDDAPGLGLSYQLELGAYPGKGGLEGYLFVGLGLALDAITR